MDRLEHMQINQHEISGLVPCVIGAYALSSRRFDVLGCVPRFRAARRVVLGKR